MVLDLAGPDAFLWLQRTENWQSVTFSGERHTFCLKVPIRYPDQRLQAALQDDANELPGMILADAGIVRLEHSDGHCWLSIEILTLHVEGGQ